MMTTIRSEPTGQLRIERISEKRARLWYASLRLWIWKYHPHLRIRPKWNTECVKESELTPFSLDKSIDIRYKHISVVIVWNIDLETPAYYMLFLRKYGDWLGNVTHLEYLNAKRK